MLGFQTILSQNLNIFHHCTKINRAIYGLWLIIAISIKEIIKPGKKCILFQKTLLLLLSIKTINSGSAEKTRLSVFTRGSKPDGKKFFTSKVMQVNILIMA